MNRRNKMKQKAKKCWYYTDEDGLPIKNGQYLCCFIDYIDGHFKYELLKYYVDYNKWYKWDYNRPEEYPQPYSWKYIIPPKRKQEEQRQSDMCIIKHCSKAKDCDHWISGGLGHTVEGICELHEDTAPEECTQFKQRDNHIWCSHDECTNQTCGYNIKNRGVFNSCAFMKDYMKTPECPGFKIRRK